MAADFLEIVITWPVSLPGESEHICRLLDGGIDFVHLRRPDAVEEEMRRLVESIREDFHSRLILHSHFRLIKEYGLGGAHLNGRWPDAPGFSTQLSCSCHSLAELACAPRFRYVTLSPVYPSISKPGYDPQPFAGFLKGKMPAPNVIALGGVTPETYPELREAGFAGAARLGDVWKPFVNNK